MKFSILLLIVVGVLNLTCVGDIDLKVPKVDEGIAIEGRIEQGERAVVFITKTSPFFTKYDSLTLKGLLVTAAKVSLSDGDTTEILQVEKNTDFFPPYVYRSTILTGVVGRTYTLQVEYRNKIYTSTSKLTPPVRCNYLKSIYDNDTSLIIKAELSDPPIQPNYYRVYSKVLHKNKQFCPSLLSVWSDNFFNGKTFAFSIYRGFDAFTEQSSSIFYSPADTVIVKLCTMDKSSFNFWFAAEKEMYTSGSAMSISKSQIVSTFDNKAYGAWTAYGVSQDTIVMLKRNKK